MLENSDWISRLPFRLYSWQTCLSHLLLETTTYVFFAEVSNCGKILEPTVSWDLNILLVHSPSSPCQVFRQCPQCPMAEISLGMTSVYWVSFTDIGKIRIPLGPLPQATLWSCSGSFAATLGKFIIVPLLSHQTPILEFISLFRAAKLSARAGDCSGEKKWFNIEWTKVEGGELRDESPAPNWLVSYGSYRERSGHWVRGLGPAGSWLVWGEVRVMSHSFWYEYSSEVPSASPESGFMKEEPGSHSTWALRSWTIPEVSILSLTCQRNQPSDSQSVSRHFLLLPRTFLVIWGIGGVREGCAEWEQMISKAVFSHQIETTRCEASLCQLENASLCYYLNTLYNH